MSDEKSFEPTQKRLKKAIKDGKVAKSREFAQTLQLTLCFYSFFLFKSVCHTILDFYHKILRDAERIEIETVGLLTGQIIREAGIMVLSIGVALVVLTVIIEVLQVGINVSFEKVMPKLSNLSPLQGTKRILGTNSKGEISPVKICSEFLQLISLSTLIMLFFWFSVRSVLIQLITGNLENINDAIIIGTLLTKKLITGLLIISFGFAIFKYYLSRRSTKQSLMMSFEELKREMKEEEGDPASKAERKMIHQEVLLNGMLNNVKKAKVIISDL